MKKPLKSVDVPYQYSSQLFQAVSNFYIKKQNEGHLTYIIKYSILFQTNNNEGSNSKLL